MLPRAVGLARMKYNCVGIVENETAFSLPLIFFDCFTRVNINLFSKGARCINWLVMVYATMDRYIYISDEDLQGRFSLHAWASSAYSKSIMKPIQVQR